MLSWCALSPKVPLEASEPVGSGHSLGADQWSGSPFFVEGSVPSEELSVFSGEDVVGYLPFHGTVRGQVHSGSCDGLLQVQRLVRRVGSREAENMSDEQDGLGMGPTPPPASISHDVLRISPIFVYGCYPAHRSAPSCSRSMGNKQQQEASCRAAQLGKDRLGISRNNQ